MADGDDRIELAETFGAVARALRAEDDLDSTLTKLVHLAVQTLDACEHAGISLVQHRRVRSGPRTDDVPAAIDDLQTEVGEGPCLDAIKEHETFHTSGLSQEGRWPEFSRRAHAETGVESILSLRLFVEEDTMGALNLYSGQEAAFGDEDIAIASVFAAHAAVAMAGARKEENLRAALESRDVIGRAKGILMAREHVTDDQAFEMLRGASQRLNVKLREVAETVTQTGETP